MRQNKQDWSVGGLYLEAEGDHFRQDPPHSSMEEGISLCKGLYGLEWVGSSQRYRGSWRAICIYFG